MTLYFIIVFFLPLCISLGIGYIKKVSDKISYCALTIYLSNICITYATYKTINKTIFGIDQFSKKALFMYIIVNFFCAISVYILYHFIRKHNGFKILYKRTFLLTLIFTNVFVYFQWLLTNYGRQDFTIFLFNLVSPVNTAAQGFYFQISKFILMMLLLSSCVVIIFVRKRIFHKAKNNQRNAKYKYSNLYLHILPILLFSASLYYPYYSFHFDQAYNYFFSKGAFIEDHYINPNTVSLAWPETKRNLIYIYVESFESSYFSKELGGLSSHNLLPNLTNLMSKGISFSNHESTFGGLKSMPESHVTITGISTMLSGVNYKLPGKLMDDVRYAVIPKITTLPEILLDQGYTTYYMQGAPVDDYQIGPYLRQHGFQQTVGYNEKIANNELPEGYWTWWGFEDKKLYEFAKNDLSELGDQNQPFYYSFTTNDTHSKDGYVDPICPLTYDLPMENAIACSDYQLSEFLNWAMEQPFYQNTTIVIAGDHIGHPDAFIETLTPDKERRIYNLILNDNSPNQMIQTQNRDAWAADMFPTVLSALGVKIEGDQLGLGVNLFSDKQTLLEEFGIDYVYNELEKRSDFYMNTFIQ